MRPYNTQIITNAVMNTTLHSAACELNKIYGYAIQAVFTGTPGGSLFLGGSADPSNSFGIGAGGSGGAGTNAGTGGSHGAILIEEFYQ